MLDSFSLSREEDEVGDNGKTHSTELTTKTPVSRSLSSLPSPLTTQSLFVERSAQSPATSLVQLSASAPTLPHAPPQSCLSLLQSLPLFRCSVTSRVYEFSGPRVPRTIKGCGHTFSEEALLSLRGQANFITCPVCEVQTSLPHNSGAEAFYINKQLLSVMKELFDRSAAAATLPLCDSDDCEQQVAVSCSECEVHLCVPCFGKIHTVGRLKLHRSEPYSSSLLAVSAGACFSNRCARHPNYYYELVCMTRDCPEYKKTLCLMCERDHKQHKTEIISIVADLERHKLEDQIKALEIRLAKCNGVISRIGDTSAAISSSKNDTDGDNKDGDNNNDDDDGDDDDDGASNSNGGSSLHAEGTEHAAVQQIREFFAQQHARLQRREESLIETVRTLAQKKKRELSEQSREVGQFVTEGYRASFKASLLLNHPDNTQFIKKSLEVTEAIARANQTNFLMVPRVTERINVFLDRDFGRFLDSLGRVEDDGVVTAQQPQRRSITPTPTSSSPLPTSSSPLVPSSSSANSFLPPDDRHLLVRPSSSLLLLPGEGTSSQLSSSSLSAPTSLSIAAPPSSLAAPQDSLYAPASQIRFNRWSDKLTVTNEYRTVSKHIAGKKSNTFCSAGFDSYSVRIDDLPPAGNNWVVGWAHPSFPLDGWERGTPCALMAAYDGVPYSSGGVVKLPLRHSSIQEPYSLQKGWIVHTKLDRDKHTVSFAVNDEPHQILLTNVPSDLHPFLRLHSVGVVLTLL